MNQVAGLVLAAGSSRRLGRPKQLLPYRGRTLLDATLEVARAGPFTQRLVTVGGASDLVREDVDLAGFDVVESVQYSEGCSSSIVTALSALHPDTRGFCLMLGDQPGVSHQALELLVSAGLEGHPIVVCRYEDGIGHPFWFGRKVFAELENLHGDKAVWKLIESRRHAVAEVELVGNVPLDVDTWDDYERLVAQEEETTA